MARKRSSKQSRGATATGREPEDPYGFNEVDDFASKREKILLDDSTLNTQEAIDDDIEPDEEEEEVLAMEDEDSSEEEYDDELEEDGEELEEELDGEKAYRKVFGRKLNLGADIEDDEKGGMLDNENAWGATKGEYYGADDLDDDETAKEIEREALRQKRQHLEEMNMADYLDDELEGEWTKEAKTFDIGEFKKSTKQSESTVSLQDIINMNSEAKLNYLNTLFPEFLPLSAELTKLSPVLENLKIREESEIVSMKIMALSSYLGVLSSYFGILLHELKNNEDFSTMKEHPVMEMLLTTKEVWRQASNLPDDLDAESGIESNDEVSDEQVNEEIGEFEQAKLIALQNKDASGHTNDSKESEEELDSNEDDQDAEDEDDRDAEDEDEEVDLDDFEEYVALSRVKKNRNTGEISSKDNLDVDDYVETEMADVDAQEKKARRRTLRFYTSKIDQQENKKIDKFKGDDDIPYKERLYERQQRLIEEARKRGIHGKMGEDLDSKDYGSEDEAVSKSMNKESEHDYFNLIQKSRQSKKDSRQQAHKAAAMAARDGNLSELANKIGDDGKRAINYQILKNKGLTPRRKKDNRNSRVKKRKKYEKAQKKLKSVRAVYSGGQSGAYEGEKTGIKKNLVKSVKFSM